MTKFIRTLVLASCAVGLSFGASGTLKVVQSPFNYSDGVNSAEDRWYTKQQGGYDGQPHVTLSVAGDATYWLYILPATRKAVQGVKGAVSLYEQLGMSPVYNALVLTCEGTGNNYDWRAALRDYRGTRPRAGELVRLSEGANYLDRFPAGDYYVMPVIRFRGEGNFDYSMVWTAAHFRTPEEGPGGTFAPILWSRTKVTIRAGETTTLSISPHPFNMSTAAKKFLQEIVFPQFCD